MSFIYVFTVYLLLEVTLREHCILPLLLPCINFHNSVHSDLRRNLPIWYLWTVLPAKILPFCGTKELSDWIHFYYISFSKPLWILTFDNLPVLVLSINQSGLLIPPLLSIHSPFSLFILLHSFPVYTTQWIIHFSVTTEVFIFWYLASVINLLWSYDYILRYYVLSNLWFVIVEGLFLLSQFFYFMNISNIKSKEGRYQWSHITHCLDLMCVHILC